MKKQISMLVFALCMVLALTAFTVGIAAALPEGYDGYTEINDEADLRSLLMGSTDAAALAGKYVLTADITIEGTDAQSPIGTTATPFTGVFDGCNHKISGIKLSGAANIGFFGVTKGATIKNLTLEGEVEANGQYVGGFIGQALFPLTLDSCKNMVKVKGVSFVGGFIGKAVSQQNQTLKVASCTNYGTTTATDAKNGRAGGLAGVIEIGPAKSGISNATVEIAGFINAKKATVTAPTMAGGVAGRIECGSAHKAGTITATNCENYANVSATGAGTAGGIFGLADNNSTTTKSFSGLHNGGEISSAGMYVGGLVGYLRVYSGGGKTMTFADCANTGKIIDSSNKGYAAGLFGTSQPQAGAIYMKRLYNAGDVQSSGSYTGAISGRYNANTTPENCYYLAGLSVSDTNGASAVVLASSVEENENLFSALNQSTAWKIEKNGPKLAALHVCAYDDATQLCTICGEKDPSVCSHDNRGSVTTKPATCTETGLQNTVCNDCKKVLETDVEVPLNPDNHVNGLFWEKNADGKYDCVCPDCKKAVIADQADLPTVYVSKLGNDAYVGTDKENPVATLPEAVSRIAATGGTVHFAESVEMTADVVLPAYSEPITFTGEIADNGLATTGIVIVSTTKKLTLGGPTIFDGILIKGNSQTKQSSVIIVGNWNNVSFGYIRVVWNALIDFYAGQVRPTGDDTEKKNITINIDGAAITSDNIDNHNLFRTIMLGSLFGAADQTISNKTITLNVKSGRLHNNTTDRTLQAYIQTLYTMSTTLNDIAFAACQTPDCSTTVNLYGNSIVKTLRTGDKNVNEAADYAGKGYLDTLALNFYDNASLGATGVVRNTKNTTLHVSSAAEGRTTPMDYGIQFAAFGTFAESMNGTVKAAYGTHSFNVKLTNPVNITTGGKGRYTLDADVANDCTFTPTVVADAYVNTCTCGRTGETIVKLTQGTTTKAHNGTTYAVRFITELTFGTAEIEYYGTFIAKTLNTAFSDETLYRKSSEIPETADGAFKYAVDLVGIPEGQTATEICAWSFVKLKNVDDMIVLPCKVTVDSIPATTK